MRRLLILLLCACLAGCVSARRRSDTTVVRKIRVRGIHAFALSDHTRHGLRQELVQQQSGRLVLAWPFSTFIAPVGLRPHVLPSDVERVETWMAHRGHFDAQARIDVRQVRKERRHRAGVVDLVVRVDRGEPTRWAARAPIDGVPPALSDGLARAGSRIRPGRRARLQDVLDAQEWLTRSLGDRGFASVAVDFDFAVDARAHEAHAAFTVDAGAPSVFGTLQSELDAPEAVIRRMAAVPAGSPFNATLLRQSRDTLLATGAFDSVEVDVDDTAGVATPTFSGTLGRPRRWELQGSVGFYRRQLRPAVSAGWSHSDLGGRLDRVDAKIEAGVTFRDVTEPIPVGGLKGAATFRDLGGFDLTAGLRADHTLFQYALPRFEAELAVPLTRPVTEWASLEVRPSIRVTRLGLDASSPLWVAVLGPDAVRAYGVVGLGLFAHLDRTRPDVDRLRGARIRAGVEGRVLHTLRPLAEASLDVRLYATPSWTFLGRPVQLLGRAEVRGVVGSKVPWPERLFLGGASDLRGFRSGQVGTYDTVCVDTPFSDPFDPDGTLDRIYVPRGGTARALVAGEVELQRLGSPDLHGAVFAEAGGLDTSGLRGAVGVGLRYESGVGPLRVDLSVRPIAPEDRGPGLGGRGTSYGCPEPRRRAYDLFSEVGRYRFQVRDFPAVNLFFSVGRAF
ncbi:MAG: BamA/TamA family outer membrane protein [Myxococcota bacterium]